MNGVTKHKVRWAEALEHTHTCRLHKYSLLVSVDVCTHMCVFGKLKCEKEHYVEDRRISC